MAATITDKMERIAQMLVDAHDDVVSAYFYTQEAIDQIERPCWLVFHEDASFENLSVDQDFMTTSFSLAFIGAVFNGGYVDGKSEYEEQARDIYMDTLLYFKGATQLQVSNRRSLLVAPLRALSGVLSMEIGNVGGVTLFTREGVSSGAFWGFTMSISVKEQLEFETAG